MQTGHKQGRKVIDRVVMAHCGHGIGSGIGSDIGSGIRSDIGSGIGSVCKSHAMYTEQLGTEQN